jgi:hypothetical protein
MSATIIPFIADRTFGPEAVASMGEALDRACAASGHPGPLVREVFASRVIALAKAGERHPQVLCDHALEGLGLSNEAREA